MVKTIQSLSPTSHLHPAVGRLFSVRFTDYSSVFMYEESFFDLLEPGVEPSRDWSSIVGKEVDLETAFVERPETLLRNREV